VTDDPEEWSDIPHYTVLPANASLDNINLNLAKLQASVARNTSTGSSNTTLDTQETLQNTRCIDGKLVGWGGILPLSWFPIRVTGDSCIPQAACEHTIQQLADDICASIPFYLGDRTRSGKMGDRNAQYPHAAGSSVPSTHYQMAPVSGGYQLLGVFSTLLNMDIKLRDGQRQWISGQLRRLSTIYNLGM
jgi:hypothetical protein